MPNINVRVSPELFETVSRYCQERDTTTSDLIRKFLERLGDIAVDQAPASNMPTLPKVAKRIPSSGFRPVSWDGSPIPERKPFQKAKG
jgi:hypothetical protein